MKDKLRLGIYLNDENNPLWIIRTIEKLINSEFSEIKLLIINRGISVIPKNIKYSLGYSIHEKLDYYLYRGRNDYQEIINTTDLFKGIQRILINSGNNEQAEETVIYNNRNEMLKYDLDFMLNFTSSLVQNNYLNKYVKYGIISYHIGDNSTIGLLNGYWNLVKKTGTEVTIRISNSYSQKGAVIFRTSLANYSNSLHFNRNQLFALASMVIPRLIRNLWLNNGTEYIDKLLINYEKNTEIISSEISKSPSSVEAFKNLLTIINRSFKRKYIYDSFANWFLLFKISAETDLFPLNIKTFTSLMPPKDRFWSDPFVISKDNRFYIFVEELFYKEGKGHITVLELDSKGKLLQIQKILEKPFHISYPFVFEWNNSYYMIPETNRNKTIELFKCTHFPDKWEFQMNLMQNITAKDTTLFYNQNKWWLFTAVNESLNSPDYFELFLFYSDDLFSSNWTPHPFNPIVTDIKTARPAGKLFIHENKIYRPSQDCSGRYGRALNLNQIITLTENSYDEKTVSKVEADWDPELKGIHTLNSDKNISIVDAYKFRNRLRLF